MRYAILSNFSTRGTITRICFTSGGFTYFIFAINDPKASFTGSIAERKKQAFKRLIDMGFRNFRFFDDDAENLRLAKELEKEYSIKMYTKQVRKQFYD